MAGGVTLRQAKVLAFCGLAPHTARNLEREELSDYLTEGALRGRDPHPDFDTSWYTLMYPDSLSADLTPLAHYLTVGQFDGRATNAAGAHLAQH